MPRHHDGRVALLSTGAFMHLDEDMPALVGALTAIGVEATAVDWHDDSIDWAGWDLVVVRSTWDYTTQVAPFLGRLAAVDRATTLANPLDVIRWNVDKRYLVDLVRTGVPVVPTDVLDPGDEPRIPDGVPCVVKPTVSAGARDTERHGHESPARARAHVAALLSAGRSVLVQPYIDGIDTAGETGLVYLGDVFSHAFRKGPILRTGAELVEGLYREEEIEPRTPSDEERATAEAVLDAVGTVLPGRSRTDLLYARVDLAPGPEGPLLMELELVEPSLFLETDPESPARVAAAIATHLDHVIDGP